MNKRQLLLSAMAPLIAPMIFGEQFADVRAHRKPRGDRREPACHAGASAKAPKDSLKGKRLCIASPVTIDQLTLFYADMQKAAKQSENGLEITVADAKGDFEKQLAQVEEYRRQRQLQRRLLPDRSDQGVGGGLGKRGEKGKGRQDLHAQP